MTPTLETLARPGTGELWVAERAGRVVAVGRGVVVDMSGLTRAAHTDYSARS